MRRLIAIACAALIFSGCALIEGKGPIANPKTGPGTDYPCGATGVQCFDSKDPDAACCPMDHSCRVDDAGPFCHYDGNEWTSVYGAEPQRDVHVQRFRRLSQ